VTTYPITPVAKPRMTRRDAWKKRPAVLKYHAFKDECRLRKVTLENYNRVTFVVPMPKSWSKKKKSVMECAPHEQTPDLDNFLKGLMDAVLDEDKHIHNLHVRKIWGHAGEIRIEECVVESA